MPDLPIEGVTTNWGDDVNNAVESMIQQGTHAARPSSDMVTGTLYSCTDHGLVYRWNGSAWATWATSRNDSVFLNAGDLEIWSGSPSRVFSIAAVAWLMDAGTAESVGAGIVLPTDWVTFDIEVWWYPTTTGTGGVQWDVSTGFLTNGTVVANTYSGTPSPSAAPGVTGQVTTQTLLSSVANQSGKPYILRAVRNAGFAGDTYAADAALFGVKLIRVS